MMSRNSRLKEKKVSFSFFGEFNFCLEEKHAAEKHNFPKEIENSYLLNNRIRRKKAASRLFVGKNGFFSGVTPERRRLRKDYFNFFGQVSDKSFKKRKLDDSMLQQVKRLKKENRTLKNIIKDLEDKMRIVIDENQLLKIRSKP